MTPMELLKDAAPEFAALQMQERALLMENEAYQSVPQKYKLLIGIAAAAVLMSDTCTQMWTKMAKANGVSDAEIIEAMLVARYMKQATVNDAMANSLSLLKDNK
jgi:alkylhydroperoxidase/carboxymuconolactone decarboxylase family protein YurZ